MSDVSLPLPLRYPPCSARPPTQTDLTRRRSVFPTTPSLRPGPWTSLKLPSWLASPHSFCTTSISSRLDVLSVCLGWIFCCTPLPPLHAHRRQVRRLRYPNHSAQQSDFIASQLLCHLSSSTFGTCSFIMHIASGRHAPTLHIAGWSHLSSFTLGTRYVFFYSCLQHLADMSPFILAGTIAVPHHLCLTLSMPRTMHGHQVLSDSFGPLAHLFKRLSSFNLISAYWHHFRKPIT